MTDFTPVLASFYIRIDEYNYLVEIHDIAHIAKSGCALSLTNLDSDKCQ
jgi:hypothetical protein